MAVELCRFTPGEERAWDEYVGRSLESGHCHLSGWRRVLGRSYGLRTRYLWVRAEGEVRGVVPLVLFRGLGLARSLVSLPFLDDGGICAEDPGARGELLRGVLGVLRELRVARLDLRHRRPSGLDLPGHGTKVTLALALPDDPERLWRGFDAKLRNQIRKAQTSGLTAGWSGVEGLDAFYRVFATNMRDLGSPVHGRRFFRAILEEFPDSARLVLVRKGSQVVAGGLCLSFKDGLQMPWASSLREHRAVCPNNLLYWEVIRSACEKGCRRFDFGRSSPGSGTYRFKRQWGAVEEPLHWQGLGAQGAATGAVDPSDPRYARLIALWKRLPVAVTRAVGPALRRHLSN
jgi:FemAB-related protein (PEP-CTERM system-associated)